MKLNRLFAVATLPLLLAACTLPASQVFSKDTAWLAQNSGQPGAQPGQRRAHKKLDTAAAAAKLGISEAQLKEALGLNNTDGQKRRPDIKGAAAKLGISEQQLVQALGMPDRPPGPNFAAAAAKLGVSEAQLKAALGVPENPPAPGDRTQRPPRPDFQAAAAKLGVSEQQLMDALGGPRRRPGGERPAGEGATNP